MSKINTFFLARKNLTFGTMWVFFTISFTYGLTCMLARPTWNFWLVLIPGAVTLYFRLLHAKASYDPTKDRFSTKYVPYKNRSKSS